MRSRRAFPARAAPSGSPPLAVAVAVLVVLRRVALRPSAPGSGAISSSSCASASSIRPRLIALWRDVFAGSCVPSIATRPSFARPAARAIRTVSRSTSREVLTCMAHPETVDRPKVRAAARPPGTGSEDPSAPAARSPGRCTRPRSLQTARASAASAAGTHARPAPHSAVRKARRSRPSTTSSTKNTGSDGSSASVHVRREKLPLPLLVRLEFDLTTHDRHPTRMVSLGSLSCHPTRMASLESLS